MGELTHYLEIKAIPQAEMTQCMVVACLMQSLHAILPAYRGQVGLSFPAYGQQNTLGGILRLFGSQVDLQTLSKQILQRNSFTDYAFVGNVIEVPSSITQYICFSRIQAKGQSAIRRSEKRLTAQGKWSQSVLQTMLENWGSRHLNLPHVHFNSGSTKQRFILWVKKRLYDHPVQGLFNGYGLSQQATVPFF